MADNKKAPEGSIHGVDAWTSNGYGLILDGKKVEPTKEEEPDIDEIEEV